MYYVLLFFYYYIFYLSVRGIKFNLKIIENVVYGTITELYTSYYFKVVL